MKEASSFSGNPAHTLGLASPFCSSQSVSSTSGAPQADRQAGDISRSCNAEVGPELAAETAPPVNVEEARMMQIV